MNLEKEFCPNCKNIQHHHVVRLTNSSGKPWRRGMCLKCGKARALPLTAKDREQFGLQKADFFKTQAWRTIRYETLRKYGTKCARCNATDKPVHVDHKKPRSKYPELSLDPANLQVLCEDCNLGKSNIYEDDLTGGNSPDGDSAA